MPDVTEPNIIGDDGGRARRCVAIRSPSARVSFRTECEAAKSKPIECMLVSKDSAAQPIEGENAKRFVTEQENGVAHAQTYLLSDE